MNVIFINFFIFLPLSLFLVYVLVWSISKKRSPLSLFTSRSFCPLHPPVHILARRDTSSSLRPPRFPPTIASSNFRFFLVKRVRKIIKRKKEAFLAPDHRRRRHHSLCSSLAKTFGCECVYVSLYSIRHHRFSFRVFCENKKTSI